MKKIISIILVIAILGLSAIFLTGCTLTLETTDNSVSATVDGDTTEKVDNIIDWIAERIKRVYVIA
mgnify:CR=1 FL=1